MRTVDLQEQEIFLNAIEIWSSVAQLDYVYQACADNISLRNRVEQLLKLQKDDSFILDKEVSLDPDGAIKTHPKELDDLTGQTLDQYHLVRQIGSGGMGDVYLAEQKEPIRRRVAVKVIKLGMDTKNFLARFTAERQALGVMDHQGITKVLDAGSTATGRPYFVMELVSGEPITQFCDESRLTLNQRLLIFRKLCNATQHAHQKGLIHRDLKPSNILVCKKDGEFAPKVIDFGVAKVTHGRHPDQTNLTNAICMIGTPEYMSPEQTDTQGSDQDIRTDIYSLGAILFELLTGSTPFELEDFKSKNIFSIREIIQTRAVEPASSRVAKLIDRKPQVFRDRDLSASGLATELRGNLDAIVLKCLAKDRAQRYASVAELVADLDIHLAGDAVSIARQPPLHAVGRVFKKHKWIAISSLVAVTCLIGISIFSMISAAQANRYAGQANEAESLAKQRLGELVLIRRDAQLERIKSKSFESKYRQLLQHQENEQIILQAVADFFEIKLENEQPRQLTVSSWLQRRLSASITPLLTIDKQADSSEGDVLLLQLIVNKMRTTLPAHDERVAQMLDLLGEKQLHLQNYSAASQALRESLLIHTENDSGSESRLRTMIFLTKSLMGMGEKQEAVSYMKTIRRHLANVPADSRLHQHAAEFDRVP